MANETRQSHGFLRTLIGTPYRRTQFRRLAVGVLAALLIALGSGLGAKERKVSRTVSGLVSDASENPISGAVVTLTDLSNGKKTATFTGSGDFQR
ncbi:MAG: carboxypeptidase-like regulatory domain-containing protein [Acidobacteriia bacterium]|nr:carboxypeptidase-like regulatory domain-containing protein [Terriglobia bacterium]